MTAPSSPAPAEPAKTEEQPPADPPAVALAAPANHALRAQDVTALLGKEIG